MQIKPVLGRYEYPVKNSSKGRLSKEKIKILLSIGVTRADVSNYRNARYLKIGKKKLKQIDKIIQSEILNPVIFKPFSESNVKLIKQARAIIV